MKLKHILFFLLLSFKLISQSNLFISGGYIHDYLIPSYSITLGGHGEKYGLDIITDIHIGENYVSKQFDIASELAVDITYAVFAKQNNVDAGVFTRINNTAQVYDGYMLGVFGRGKLELGRGKLELGRVGIFGSIYYPVYGKEISALDHTQVNTLFFNKLKNKNLKPLRETHLKIIMGFFIKF